MILVFTNKNILSKWKDVLSEKIETNKERPKKLLVFVNPFGGGGRGKVVWERKVKDFFQLVKIKLKVDNK